jgi:hypothetical protein
MAPLIDFGISSLGLRKKTVMTCCARLLKEAPTQHFPDELTLAVDVRFPIVRKARRERLLELAIVACRRGVSSQVITKSQVLSPQFAVLLDEMNVIGAWLSAAKELVARDTAIAPVDVPGSLEGYDVIECEFSRRVAGQDVEHRFGAKTRHCGASDMLETDWKGATRCGEALGLSEKQRRPGRIVRHDANRTRLKAE